MLFPLLLFAAVSSAKGADMTPPASAELCGRCHRGIHEAWKTSSHAQAMESRLFQDALALAEGDFGVEARKTCLECHAPIAVKIGDLRLEKKVSWEGVTCDYCHSVREVSLDGPVPKVVVTFVPVKSGPWKDSVSTGHGVAYSPLHTSSKLCASCHEYKNALGFPVLTTYSEWKDSSYAKEGKQCQTCHMYRVAGDVVDPRLSRAQHAQVNLHQMPGSHSLPQLTRAVKAQLFARREGGGVQVRIDLINQLAGHSFPTGSPLRQLVLKVSADSYGGQKFHEERVLTRKVADQHGTVLGREHFVFLKASKVVSDTRLAPGEKRSETFSFPIPAGTRVQVNATLIYVYSPMARTQAQQQVTFLTLSQFLN
jgi:hypothetical protein